MRSCRRPRQQPHPLTPSSRFDGTKTALDCRGGRPGFSLLMAPEDTALPAAPQSFGDVAGRLCKEEGQRRPTVPTLLRNAQLFLRPAHSTRRVGYLGYDEVIWETTKSTGMRRIIWDARRGCLGCGESSGMRRGCSGCDEVIPDATRLLGCRSCMGMMVPARHQVSRSRIGRRCQTSRHLSRGKILTPFGESALAGAFVCTRSLFRLRRLKRIVELYWVHLQWRGSDDLRSPGGLR